MHNNENSYKGLNCEIILTDTGDYHKPSKESFARVLNLYVAYFQTAIALSTIS